MPRFSTLIAGALCCTLAGCIVPIPGSKRTVTPTPQAGASTAVAPATSGQQDLLNQVNAFRASQGQSALAFSPVLAQAAQGHANEMAARNVLSHQGADGSTPSVRAERVGYGWCRMAENIAQGQKTLAEAMVSWENSPGHRRNLLDSAVTEVGLGQSGDYWAMVFGTPGC